MICGRQTAIVDFVAFVVLARHRKTDISWRFIGRKQIAFAHQVWSRIALEGHNIGHAPRRDLAHQRARFSQHVGPSPIGREAGRDDSHYGTPGRQMPQMLETPDAHHGTLLEQRIRALRRFTALAFDASDLTAADQKDLTFAHMISSDRGLCFVR